MSAWRPRSTALGGLPNISFIMRKPEPLGTELKCVACPVTGCMLNLEIQRGKEGMKDQKYNQALGATTGCTLRLMEEAAGEESFQGIIGDAWFGSTRTVSELARKNFEGIFQIKQYASLFPKKFIEDALKDAPGGVKIVLEGIHPSGKKLIAIGYQYRYCFVILFHFYYLYSLSNHCFGVAVEKQLYSFV